MNNMNDGIFNLNASTGSIRAMVQKKYDIIL